jgi:predicted RNA-binding protein with PUA-like domain
MATFLFKTEPGEYSFQRLMSEKRAVWNGITNNAALAHLRSAGKGDQVFIYHTGDEKAIVGLAEIVSAPYEDPENPGRNAAGAPKFPVVDLRAVKHAKAPLTLAAIKADDRFKDFALVRQSRLSVMPVPPELDRAIRKLTGLAAQ